MASNNFSPQWFFGDDPALSQQSKDGLKQVMMYLWSLRDGQTSLVSTVQNLNTNITQQVTALSGVVANMANNSNNSATPAVIFGSHAQRLTGTYLPSLFPGYLYLETDRNFALYYSNGVQWILIEATGSGSFETRWTGLGPFDAGFNWYETSRSNVNSTPPMPYYRWSGGSWDLISGEWYRNQNAVTTLANTFAANNSNNGNDVGAIVNVIDFAGQLQWQNNNTWNWGPDDDEMHGSGPILREVDPAGGWWHLYDGANNVTYLQANGNVGTVATLPPLSGANASGNTFLAGGNVNSNINPPVAPAFSGASSLNTTSGNFDTGGANTAPAITSVSGNITGNISNNGTPQSLVRRAWFRR